MRFCLLQAHRRKFIPQTNSGDVWAFWRGAFKRGASSVQVWLDGENGREHAVRVACYRAAPTGEKLTFHALWMRLKLNISCAVTQRDRQPENTRATMIAAGRKDDEAVARIADETVGAQGIMSYIFGLHLITNGAPSENYTADSVISEILSPRRDDGGWSLTERALGRRRHLDGGAGACPVIRTAATRGQSSGRRSRRSACPAAA